MEDTVNILVTGATGTLGRAVIDKLLSQYSFVNITGISRDEQKQRTMPKDERLTMKIADIRDLNSLCEAMNIHKKNYLIIFHFAALKCVDTLEDNPREAIKTNVIGTENVVHIARNIFAKVVMASTDKAAYPINTYGMSKSLAEKVVLYGDPENAVCRYGNVLGSRGSLLESLKKSLIEKQTAYITDERMTRFWMTLNQARDFVLHCAFNDKRGLQLPFFIKSSLVIDMISATAEVLGVKDYKIEKIGIRPGEKIHEVLCTEFEPGHKKVVSSLDDDRLMTHEELKELIEKALAI